MALIAIQRHRTLKRSAIPIEEVNDILSGVKAQQTLTIIDACRNDPSAGRSNQDNLLSENFARGFQLEPRTDVGQPAVTQTSTLVVLVNAPMSGQKKTGRI